VTQRTGSLGGTLTYVYDSTKRVTSAQLSGKGPTGTVVRVDLGYDARNEQTSKTWYSKSGWNDRCRHECLQLR
jgi:hypothetical protein